MISVNIALGTNIALVIYLFKKLSQRDIEKDEMQLFYYIFDLKIWKDDKIIYYHLISNYVKKFIMSGALVLLSPYKEA